MSKAAAVPSRIAAVAAVAALLVAIPSPSSGQSTVGVQADAPALSGYYFRFAGGAGRMDALGGQFAGNLSLAFGKHAFFSTLRGEVEVSFASGWSEACQDLAAGSRRGTGVWCNGSVHGQQQRVRALSVMTTAYFDFREGEAFRPFIGAGLRYEARGTTTRIGETLSSAFGMGANLTAGVAYAVRPSLAVQLAYQALVASGGDDRLQLGFRYRR